MNLFLDGLLLFATLVYSAFALAMVIGLTHRKDETADTAQPDVTVIIAARDEEHDLPHLLDDLLAQDYPAEKVAIIIADDRSRDRTPEILDHYTGEHDRITAIHITELNPDMTPKKWALTCCLEAAETDVILATDADCRVPPTWVRAAVRHLNSDTGIASGYSSVSGESWFERYQNLDFIGLMSANMALMNLGLAWSGSGQNLVYRKAAFREAGGFRPVAHRLSGDDVYLIQGISNLKSWRAKAIWDREHFVSTQAMPTVKAFLNQRIRWASNSDNSMGRKPLFFSFLLSAFLTNTAILFNLLCGNPSSLFTAMLTLKFILEGAVLSMAVQRYHQWSALPLYPLWFVLQPIYIPLMGLAGLLKAFKWKP